MPRAVVITKIDHQRADFATVLAECQGGVRRRGAAAVPAGRPARAAPGVSGLIGLLSETLYDYSVGDAGSAAEPAMTTPSAWRPRGTR